MIVVGWITVILLVLWLVCGLVSTAILACNDTTYTWKDYLVFTLLGPISLYITIKIG